MEDRRSLFVVSAAVVSALGAGAFVMARKRATHAVVAMSAALERLPRELHPAAWWIWALGMATAATRTTNPLLLGAIIAVVAFVVSARRGDAPWSSGFRGYVVAALVVIAVRVALRTVLDGQYGEHVLLHLPELPLPSAAEGIRIGGPVSLEGLLAAFYDGLRLATLILCIGAANVLANPKRLLKSTPSSLHEIGVSITVALTVAPQLVESARRVRRARRLRGGNPSRRHILRQVVVPVMTDALDRSILLAAAMDARGHGRTVESNPSRRLLSGALVLVGLCGVCVGVYGLLDATTPTSTRRADARRRRRGCDGRVCDRRTQRAHVSVPPRPVEDRRVAGRCVGRSPSPRGCSSRGMSIPTT